MAVLLEAQDIHLATDERSWWVWACWRTSGTQRLFVYGCAAWVEQEPDRGNSKKLPLSGDNSLVVHQRIFSQEAFSAFLAGHTTGLLDFEMLFGASASTLQIRAQRYVIHAALGHTASRVHAYCSMPEAEAVFGSSAADLQEILHQLQQELGLPFEHEYLAHIGNFEVFILGEWGERPPPFLIETEPTVPIGDVPRSSRALAIARTSAFATKTHFAHVVIRESDEVLEERLVTLPPGMNRSDPIEVTDVIDGFEFYLFTEEGTLLHREVGNFFREAGGVIAIGGTSLRLDDRLSRSAIGVSSFLAQAAAVVQSRTSSRFHVAPESGTLSYRSFSARMRAFVHECSPPKSDDRFFKRSLGDEVAAIQHINMILDGGTIRSAILVDPYFGIDALRQIALRLSSRDVALTIVTSWVKVDPDTGAELVDAHNKTDLLHRALVQFQPFFNIRLKLLNLADGNEPAFHDRYLLLYPHEGSPKVYILSNSLNRIAGKWPFCMSVLADDIRPEVQNYIEGLAAGKDVTGCTSPQITYSWPRHRG